MTKLDIKEFDWYLSENNALWAIKKDDKKQFIYNAKEKKLVSPNGSVLSAYAGGASEEEVKYILKNGYTGEYA